MSKKIKKREKIGQALVRMGFMSRNEVDEVLKAQVSREGTLFGAIAVDLGFIEEKDLNCYLETNDETEEN